MQIEHLKYKEIDFVKYDNCVKNAVNSRVYAYSWYLNIVCNKDWEVLILGDYDVVMPLPFKRIKRKFLKRMVEQPFFCQQLGVFSLTELSLNVFQLFINKFKTFSSYSYQFNAENSLILESNIDFNERVNYELNLKNTYPFLFKNFSKGLKSNIKKAQKNKLKIKKGLNFSEYKKMKIENSFHKIKAKDFKMIKSLIQQIIAKKQGDFYAVYKDNMLISASFLITTNQRIIYLFSSTNKIGKSNGATSFLLNHIIETNCNKNIIFDFEGSVITGLAKFFKSFGAKSNPYFVLNNKL